MCEHRPHNSGITPPQWADRFLRWYCAPKLLDEIQGDLYEAFYLRAEKYGLWKARLFFVKEVFQFCKPSSFEKSIHTNNPSNMRSLFQNYFKIAWRNAFNSKLFSTINIVGLAIGFASCLLIIQYVHFEWSYDKFHQRSNQIYRVLLEDSRAEGGINAANMPGAGPALKSDFPEVIEYARALPQSIFMGNVSTWSHVNQNGDELVFNEEKVYDVDPSFTTIFSFPFIYGDSQTALLDANAVVISETVSHKFFGDENPIGKVLELNGQISFVVTGVFEDIPENSHIKFDLLVSYFLREGWGRGWNHDWDWNWPEFFTYILLDPQSNPNNLKVKLPNFVDKYLGDNMAELAYEAGFQLQALTDIHLNSRNTAKEQEAHGNQSAVYFLLTIAFLILVIAWINYINLSTSKSIERAREVGIRKVAGASKPQLIAQFLSEAAMVNFSAIFLALVLTVIAVPSFNLLSGKNIGASVWEYLPFREPWFWSVLVGVFMGGSFFAGMYPAFILSSLRVVSVVKGKFLRSNNGTMLRKTLVGFQFVISVALISCTVMVFEQVSFMRNQELGYNKDELLIVKSPNVGDSTFQYRYETFRTELKRIPEINNLAPSSEIPGRLISNLNTVRNIGETKDDNFLSYHYTINKDFLDTYGIDLLAGRNFREEDNYYQLDEREDPIPIMVNDKLRQSLGYQSKEEAIGQLISFGLGSGFHTGEIIGVTATHHQESLEKEYVPILFFPAPGWAGQYLTINLNVKNPSQSITLIEKQYKAAFPGNQFEYFFLDDYFDRQYMSNQQFGRVFGLFTCLALFVACLGLLGLSTFMISQRTKEIAVRKILGATLSSVMYLFSKDFVKLTILANIIALPLVYVWAKGWLDNFAFKVGLDWVMFALPMIVLLVISLVTVGIQTIKTGSINPVNSLRSE